MPDVVGLDLSLTSTGMAHGDVTESFQPKTKGMQRLHDILCEVVNIVVKLPDPFVVVEGYSFSSRNSHAHALGELGGVIRFHLWQRQVPYVDVPPTCRAKFATGKGNAGKAEVVSAVSARTGRTWVGKGAEDECDAWVLQEMGLCRFNAGRFSWPAANLSTLSTIDWPDSEHL
jgi:Holliday junction resolvasome RuvABC endonuclease subunit